MRSSAPAAPVERWISSKLHVPGLETRRSGIPGAGDGLFTTRALRKNTLLGFYDGRVLTQNELDRIYPGDSVAAYGANTGVFARDGTELYIDAKDPERGNLLRYINDSRDASRNNCDFFQSNNGDLTDRDDDLKRAVGVKLLRDVAAGEELFLDYGEEYWKSTTGTTADAEEELDGVAMSTKSTKRRTRRPKRDLVANSPAQDEEQAYISSACKWCERCGPNGTNGEGCPLSAIPGAYTVSLDCMAWHVCVASHDKSGVTPSCIVLCACDHVL